ncbi:hypothetical protein AVEN_139834-1 [Araneus ventricosus]|uniref:Uncharacterized protein n=1 Tax=Araneus ventricosus TaxID=182803 RepID=A0A4Y2JCF2_ARAVE|nr:hypothetical protein AVEN_139834-1 [Araneus ventricosus]
MGVVFFCTTMLALHCDACEAVFFQTCSSGDESSSNSPDLAPTDFSLLPKLKNLPKEIRFKNAGDIKKSILKEDFNSCFRNLYSRAQKCITAGGSYFGTYLMGM